MKILKIFLQLLCLAPLAGESALGDDYCPLPVRTPDAIEIVLDNNHGDQAANYLDKNRSIKDLGTDIVVKEFFKTPDTLYNFMELVYTTIEKSLAKYSKEHNLEENTLSELFKGGNVLRIVANGVFAQVEPDLEKFLREKYERYFSRSDADFSVYVNAEKLGNLTYEKVYDDIAGLIYEDLNKIRGEFLANPQKYFNFLQLKPEEARKELAQYFTLLNELPALEDKANNEWYKAQFKQLQVIGERVNKKPDCKYIGEYDYRFTMTHDGKIAGLPLSSKPSWIVNTDNRTPEWPLGSDKAKKIKFALVRSKIAFEYTYEKDREIFRKNIGGELIDVSIPHRDSYNTKDFFDNYNKKVATYTLKSPWGSSFKMKAYSFEELADDLQGILFNSFDRPWNGGEKYTKRVMRIFFLFITEILANYGSASPEAQAYVDAVEEKIIKLLKNIYQIKDNREELISELKNNINYLKTKWPKMSITNNFWQALIKFITERLIADPAEKDQPAFQEFLRVIIENVENMQELNHMQPAHIDLEKIYDVDIRMIF